MVRQLARHPAKLDTFEPALDSFEPALDVFEAALDSFEPALWSILSAAYDASVSRIVKLRRRISLMVRGTLQACPGRGGAVRGGAPQGSKRRRGLYQGQGIVKAAGKGHPAQAGTSQHAALPNDMAQLQSCCAADATPCCGAPSHPY